MKQTIRSIVLEITREEYQILEEAAGIERRTVENYILYWLDIITSASRIRTKEKEFEEYKGMMTPYERSVLQKDIDNDRQKFKDRRDNLNLLLDI